MQKRTLDVIIEEHAMFRGLRPEHLVLVAGCATNVRFNPGEYIYRQDDPANYFYLIRHGKVSLDLFVPGRGSIVVQTLVDDDILGYSWLFPPHYWDHDARALELTRAVAFDAVCLRTKCEEDYVLGYEFMRRFANMTVRRLKDTQLRLLDMYGAPAGPA
jgi:CRP-like cAMP-binding protein